MRENRFTENPKQKRAGRLACFFMAAAVTGMFFAGCSAPAKPENVVSSRSVSEKTISAVSAVKEESSSKAASEKPATAPTTPETGKIADFSDTAMIGNSYVNTLETFGLIPQMDFYDRVGLSVRTVFKLPTSMGSVPIIDALGAKKYRTVYLLFGENELGWEGTKPFYNAYAAVVDAVRARQPDAKIVIQSIFPLSVAESAKNKDGANNKRIVQFNDVLRELAENKGAVYLDVWSAMAGSDGALPACAASDGIHPNKKYCQLWVDYLSAHAK